MGIRSRAKGLSVVALATVASLLGQTVFEARAAGRNEQIGILLEDATVDQIREAMGGQLQPLPSTRLRWYLSDLETAQRQADSGNLRMASQLYRAMRRDGMIAGLLGTRSAGLVRLPKRFYGDPEVAAALMANNGTRSVFDEMFPPAELAMLAADGVALGVGIAEMVPVEGREYPVMVRLDPENLVYLWTRNLWYFKSVAGLLEIHPGDGRWILHLPGARMTPWNAGLWPAMGRAFINKEHAISSRANYSAKLANPARVATAPLGASEVERKNFFKRLMAWGLNSVFDLPIGWDVKLLESNGIGIKVFQSEIDTSNEELQVAICGQVVTTTGGTGFVSSSMFRAIRQDLIKSDGEALAYTINTQGIPIYLVTMYGDDALETRFTTVQWDTSTPTELATEATTLSTVGGAISSLREVLAGVGRELDVDKLCTRFAIPLKSTTANDVSPSAAQDDSAAAAGYDTAAKALAAVVSRFPDHVRKMGLSQLAELSARVAA